MSQGYNPPRHAYDKANRPAMPTSQDYTQARRMPSTRAGPDRPADGAIRHVHDDECAPDGASEPYTQRTHGHCPPSAYRGPGGANASEKTKTGASRPCPAAAPVGTALAGDAETRGRNLPSDADAAGVARRPRLAAALGPNPSCKCRKLLRQGRQRLPSSRQVPGTARIRPS